MEPVKFVAVTQQAQVHMVCELAARIWKEHYTPIIGGEQVDYMLETLQSVPAVTRQMEQEGYQYYLLETGGRTAGYVGIQPGGGKLFLSKLYVDKSFRGKKLARRALEFLEQYCREHGLPLLAALPFEREAAEQYAGGRLLADLSPVWRERFAALRDALREAFSRAMEEKEGGHA